MLAKISSVCFTILLCTYKQGAATTTEKQTSTTFKGAQLTTNQSVTVSSLPKTPSISMANHSKPHAATSINSLSNQTQCPSIGQKSNDVCSITVLSIPSRKQVEYKQLCNKWCAPYFKNNASELDVFLDKNVSLGWICACEISPKYNDIPYWMLDATIMYWFAFKSEMDSIHQYIKSKNYNVEQYVTNRFCRSIVKTNIGRGLYFYLFIFLNLQNVDLPGMYMSSSVMFLWTPFAIVSAFFSYLVLHHVIKSLGKGGMPCQILYKSEIVGQFVCFLIFPNLYNINFLALLLSPFCFLSGLVYGSADWYASMEPEWLKDIQYSVWIFQPMLKCAILIERICALHFPVFYRAKVTKRNADRIFAVGLFSYVVFASLSYYYVRASFTNTWFTHPITAQYWISFFGLFSCLQIFFALILTLNLLKTRSTVLPKDDNEHHRRSGNRNLAKMVIASTGVNIVAYFFIIIFLIGQGYNTCRSDDYVNCGSYWATSIYHSDILSTATTLAVDLNPTVCFFIQIILLQSYCQAAKQVFVMPLKKCF